MAGNTLLKFFFGEMLHQLREDGASRVHPSLFHPVYRRKEVNPKYMPIPHSINIGQSDNIVVELEAYHFRVGGIETTTLQNVSELCNEKET